jgi:hypothetical protein
VEAGRSTGAVRAWNNLPLLRVKHTDDVLGWDRACWRWRALVDNADPPVAKTLRLRPATWLIRTVPSDDIVHEIDEYTVACEDFCADGFTRTGGWERLSSHTNMKTRK